MENVYYILMIFGIILMGYFWYLSVQLKRLDMKYWELEHTVDNCTEVLSKVTEKVHELDKEMETSREAVENWSEAAKIARKSEEDYNEGLNNILNFQPTVKQKGDKN